jgi:hypothetical protein
VPDAGTSSPSLVLGPVLRHVTGTSATIWVETSAPCRVGVLGVEAATFTVEGHHYALVVVEGLSPGRVYEYEVTLDGVGVWPLANDPFPPPVVRTLDGGSRRILFGSCRAAAPHEPPYTLELDHDRRGRGVDALRAHALRMLQADKSEWPDLLVLLGDQVYADDPSPRTERRLARLRRFGRRRREAPKEVVADYEQYTWLYHEAWTPSVERWVLSVVPSTMVFDDHDMIDDWNISESWVAHIRRQPWWQEHIIGGLMTYFVYQHLGNLSPERLKEEGLLEELTTRTDATEFLRQWASESEHDTPVSGGYHFNYHRDIGDVRLIVIDTRNGRVLEPDRRAMVDEGHWRWITDHAEDPFRHLLIASSVPVLVPGGLHGLQQWNEAVCAGRWGRPWVWIGERIRRGIDLEDWAAFDRSFRAMCELLERTATRSDAPETITLLSGDIHFAYVASVELREPSSSASQSRIRQVVSSPIRNALVKRERRVIDFAVRPAGRKIGSWLERRAGITEAPIRWELDHDPIFDNNIGMITVDERSARLVIERARPDDDGEPILETMVDVEL